MGRIVFAWELGSNFGHLARLLPVARTLRARGHAIDFAIRELPRGQTVLAPHGFAMLQAPLWTGRAPAGAAAPNYAGVLQRCGYHSVPALSSLVAGWRRLFDLLAPELVILDHAPTASLAALIEGIPTARVGSGWAAPPDQAPLPSLQPWRAVDPRITGRAEAQVLAVVNAVLRGAGRPALPRVSRIFQPAAEFLTTFAELDHYGARPGARYYGSTQEAVSATPPDWPAAPAGGDAARVFGFVDAAYAGLDALFGDLARLGLPALLYVRDLAAARARAASAGGLRVVAAPVDMAAALAAAAVVVCHASHGTLAAALLAGRPLLMLPRQAEQRLLGERVTALGAGLLAGATRARAPDHAAALSRILETPSFAAAARGFAARHAGHDVAAAAAAIADGCEAVLARQPAQAAS